MKRITPIFGVLLTSVAATHALAEDAPNADKADAVKAKSIYDFSSITIRPIGKKIKIIQSVLANSWLTLMFLKHWT